MMKLTTVVATLSVCVITAQLQQTLVPVSATTTRFSSKSYDGQHLSAGLRVHWTNNNGIQHELEKRDSEPDDLRRVVAEGQRKENDNEKLTTVRKVASQKERNTNINGTGPWIRKKTDVVPSITSRRTSENLNHDPQGSQKTSSKVGKRDTERKAININKNLLARLGYKPSVLNDSTWLANHLRIWGKRTNDVLYVQPMSPDYVDSRHKTDKNARDVYRIWG